MMNLKQTLEQKLGKAIADSTNGELYAALLELVQELAQRKEGREEKKKVYLGDCSNLSNKMLYVQAIIEQEKGKAGEIFVNGDLNNKFNPYFREEV